MRLVSVKVENLRYGDVVGGSRVLDVFRGASNVLVYTKGAGQVKYPYGSEVLVAVNDG